MSSPALSIAPAPRMQIAKVSCAKDTAAKIETVSFAELAALLGDVKRGKKDGTGWMPATLSIPERHGANVTAINYLVLDVEAKTEKVKGEFDQFGDQVKVVTGTEPPSVDTMAAMLEHILGWSSVVHTSYSHILEHSRYRVVIELSRPLLPAEVKRVGEWAAKKLGLELDSYDRGALEPARFYYLPRCPSAERLALFECKVIEGKALDVDQVPVAAPKPPPAPKQPKPPVYQGIDQSVVDEVRSALMHLIQNNHPDYNMSEYTCWANSGLKLKSLGEAGYSLWREVSNMGANGCDETEARRKWESDLKDPNANHKAIFSDAQNAGWINPRSFNPHAVFGAAPVQLHNGQPLSHEPPPAPEVVRQLMAEKYAKYYEATGSEYIHIPESLSGSVITKLAKRAAHTMEIPLGTVFTALLGGAAASVATNYVTQFITGTKVPAVIQAVCEHPPSTGKSNLKGQAINSYQITMYEHNRRIAAVNNAAGKEGVRLPYGFEVITDGTTAAIDSELSSMDSGRVFIASDEQAAFQSLFPENTFSSNNSLLLNGWMGEYISGSRTTRKAFSGYVQTGVLLIAQVGSIQRVLSASNQTGLAERFLFSAEASLLGSRTLDKGYLSTIDKAAFNKAATECVTRYSKRVYVDGDNVVNRAGIDSLEVVEPRREGYEIIKAKRQEMEPFLGELRRAGEMTFLGWVGKMETHVLKIATVMHVFDCLGNGREVDRFIPDELIKACIELVMEYGKHIRGIIQSSGEAGDTAEMEAVMDAIEKSPPMKVERAKQVLKKRAPFRAREKPYIAAGMRIQKMLDEGFIIKSALDGSLRIV